MLAPSKERSSFLKKRSKRLFIPVRLPRSCRERRNKSLLVLFFRKEHSPYLGGGRLNRGSARGESREAARAEGLRLSRPSASQAAGGMGGAVRPG